MFDSQRDKCSNICLGSDKCVCGFHGISAEIPTCSIVKALLMYVPIFWVSAYIGTTYK